MIDFSIMVRNALFENVATTSTATSGAPLSGSTSGAPLSGSDNQNGNEKQEASNILDFFRKGPFAELKTYWETNFRNFPFCTEADLNELITSITWDRTRSAGDGKVYQKLKNLENIFPLVDLIVSLYDLNFKQIAGTDKNGAKKTYDTFLNQKGGLKEQRTQNPNLRPLDYVPRNVWAKNIKMAKLQGGSELLAKLRFNAMLQEQKNSSIFQAIMYLLQIRKKLMLPYLNKALAYVDGSRAINDILLAPWELVKGTNPINDAKLQAIYDKVTALQLVDLSLTAYQLYLYQISIHIGEPESEKYKTNPEYYEKFMGSKGATEFVWPTASQQNESYTFDFLLKLLSEQSSDIIDRLNRSFAANQAAIRSRRELTNSQIAKYLQDQNVINTLLKDDNLKQTLINFLTKQPDSENQTSLTDEEIIDLLKDENVINNILKDDELRSLLSNFLTSQEEERTLTDEEIIELLKDEKTATEVINDPTIRPMLEEFIQNQTSPENKDEQKQLKAFENENNKFQYNLSNLEAASKNFEVEQATNLLKQMEKLANYIKTKSSSDTLGRLAQASKGLSFGTTNMGK